MKSAYRIVIALQAVVWPADSLHAQDIEAMMKWTTAQAIHYDVVAEYKGETSIVSVPPNSPISGYGVQVADRYEIGFDWNPQSMAIVGTATIKNLPATLPNGMPAGKCGAPKLTGTYDHVEVVGAKTGPAGSNSLELNIKRSYPAAAISYANEKDICSPLNAPAKTSMETGGLMVPLGMFFVMPTAVPSNITVGKDGKTMTLKDRQWTYTYTMQIVK